LYGVLLTAYAFITVIPAGLVMATYLTSDPAALADHVSARLGLGGSTAALLHDVLSGAGENQLGSTLIAVADVCIFGLGIGRVLQLAYARSWRIDLPTAALTDQARYLAVLLVPIGLLLLYLVQATLLAGEPASIAWLLVPLWAAAVVVDLVWTPRLLLHHRIGVRDALPGAVFATLGFLGLYLIRSLLFKHWLEWYSTYYGGLGIVMALFFWLMLGATVVIVAAALSPALAARRDLLSARAGAG
jgi:uncharacterized BrkB/YihY/UPF0761 family membrane protein